MDDSVYDELIEHMDRYPGGVRTSGDGAKKLLQMLFSRNEAELALTLDLGESSPADVAERTGKNEGTVATLLSTMAKKGLIFERLVEAEGPLYQGIPVVVGIYEFQVGHLDRDLVAAFDDYFSTKEPKRAKKVGAAMCPMRVA